MDQDLYKVLSFTTNRQKQKNIRAYDVLGSNLFDELRILRKIYMCAERNGFNRNLPLDRRAFQRNEFLGFIGDLLYIMGF